MAELRAYNPTFRERSTQYVANLLRDKFGMDNYRSYDLARDIFGDESSPTMLGSMGIADFTPAGAIFGGQEGARMYKRSADLVGKGLGAGIVGLSALEGLGPLGLAVKAGKKVLPKADVPDNPDLQRRAVVKGLAALPVATTAVVKGIDSIPLGKLAKGVRPLPDVVSKLSPAFRSKVLESLPSWTNSRIADTVIKKIDEAPSEKVTFGKDPSRPFEGPGMPPPGIRKAEPYSFQANYVQDQVYFLDSMREGLQAIPARFRVIDGQLIPTEKQTTPMKDLYPTKESFFEDLNKGVGMADEDMSDQMKLISTDLTWDFIQNNGDLSLGDAIQLLNGERKKLLENPELVAEVIQDMKFKDTSQKPYFDEEFDMMNFADGATFGERGENVYGALRAEDVVKLNAR